MPPNAGKGRKVGVPNKIPAAIKEAALGALNAGDGAQAFFEARKETSPDAFMGFLKSVLPLDVRIGDPNGDKFSVTIQFPFKKDEP
jgi:hypothetical protein